MIESLRAARPASPSAKEPLESGPRWTSVALIAASVRGSPPAIPQIPHTASYSRDVPVYWKPRYATRSQRHRAFVRVQARREEALREQAGPSLWRRLAALLSRGG